ncbi:hypothetical protein [Atopomonas sediminilitoris]|uniref:hypothetical protein n=1 Tax=Atopomonas sediminilitoris TaxID=2919919 RepID=UPI001F4F08AA|nr:hypothetical protein [Atopomonas sediminilitoris]MCJ8170911.1 hypothetical protein [Atopomonas sediminilitoris]
MSLFWSKGAHQGQKIISILTFYLFFSAPLYTFAYHDFVPSELVFWPALILSLIFSTGVICFVILEFKNKTWKPSVKFLVYSRSKKIMAGLALAICLFLFSLLNFYYIIPRAITSFTGEENTKIDTVTAHKNIGRREACKFSIKSQTVKSFIFKICTTSYFYSNSPEGKFYVKIYLIESPLGLIISGVDRAQ